MKWGLAALAASVLACAPDAGLAQDTWSGRGVRAESGDTLPPDFRGRIVYSGSYEAEVTRTGGPIRRPTARNMLRGLGGGATRELAGTYTVEIRYDGRAVSGRYSGTGGMNPGSFTGTRSGTRCHTVDAQSGEASDAECTRTRFAVDYRGRGARHSSVAHIEAEATQFVDAAIEEREQQVAAAAERRRQQLAAPAIEAERQRVAAAEARAEAAEVARIARLPRASAVQARLLGDAIAQDSQSWFQNRYAAGSLRNVRIWESGGGETVVRGEFSYLGGGQGWIRGRIAGGRVLAIQYQDTFGYAAVRVPGANDGGAQPARRCVRSRDANGAPNWGPC